MKKVTLIVLIIAVFLSALLYLYPDQYYLTLYSPQSDEVYFRENVEVEDEVSIVWTHSVEHTPWKETLRISDDGHLIMTETQFQSYGAGAPQNTNGDVSVEDGFIVITDINEAYETYNWFHSHDADFTVTIGDDRQIKQTDLPDETAIEMKVERSSFLFQI